MTYYINAIAISDAHFHRRRSDDNFNVAHQPAEVYPYVERIGQKPTSYNLSFDLTGSERYNTATSIKAEVRPGNATYLRSTDNYLYGTDQELWLSPTQLTVKEGAGEVLKCDLRSNINPGIVHSCDFATDWTKTNFATVSANTTVQATGRASIMGYKSSPGSNEIHYAVKYTPTTNWDWSGKDRLTCWYRCNDATVTYTGVYGLRLYSGAMVYSAWGLTTITADTWHVQEFDLSAADYASGGGVNLASVDYLQLSIYSTSTPADPLIMYVDDIRVY